MKKIEVVAAILVHENKILCMQRGKGKYDYISYKYEFPGGKIDPGENPAQALMREIKEEMDLEIDVKDADFFMTVEHSYPDFHITMHSFICKVENKNFVRKEHNDHCWLKQDELQKLDWAPADVPITERLCKISLA